MSASSSVSSSAREFPNWVLPLHEDDRSIFHPITPCIYMETDIPPRKIEKKDELSNPKYIPLIFSTPSGTPYKVYLYLRSLELLGMSINCVKMESIYDDLKNVLTKMTPLQKRKLKLFEYIFDNYRSQEPFNKYQDPSRFFSYLPKYNKRVLVSLFNRAIAALAPHELKEGLVNSRIKSSFQRPSQTFRFTEKSQHFIVNIFGDKVTIITIPGVCVGQGVHSAAYKAYNYSLGRFQVYKKCKLDNICGTDYQTKNENNIKHLQREIDILEEIHRKTPEKDSITGLVDRVTAIFTFPYPLKPYFCWEFLTTEYLTDLEKFNLIYKRSPNELPYLLNGALDLLKGLKYLQNVNILHGDIKPANVFVKSFKPLSLCIGDVGGAVREDRIQLSIVKIEGTVCTPAYYNQRDFISMARAVQANDSVKWIQIHRARDLAASVLTILEMLASYDFLWSGTQHIKELTRILEKESEDLFWGIVRRFLELLDLGQATKESIANILSDSGFNDERLTDFFVDVLRDEWILRPTVDEVIAKLEKLIPLEV